MFVLSKEEESILLALSNDDSYESVERKIREIAAMRKVEWTTWFEWQGPKPMSHLLMSWAATHFDKRAYLILAGFAFGSFLKTIKDPQEARRLVERFADSIQVVAMEASMSAEIPEASASERAAEAIALALYGEPALMLWAFTALEFATKGIHKQWMDDGWKLAIVWSEQDGFRKGVRDPGDGEKDSRTL